MDILTDIFKQADLRRRLLNQRALAEPVVLRFPCDKSIGFHVVTQGEAFLYLNDKKPPVNLKKGDLAFMARGLNHFLSTESDLSAKDLKVAVSLDESDRKNKNLKKLSPPKVTLVSGAYQLWNDPIHPFFKELPEIFVLKNSEIESFGQIQSALNMLSIETSNPQIGSEGLVQNLLDIIFSYLVRKIIDSNSSKPKTLSFAVQNESIKKSIELLHSQLDRNWTLEDLAKEVGLSRAGLAQKFKKSLGDTPLHYLTLIRMQKARALLSTTDDNLEIVAGAVGYSDPFSFSKVFKRITGLPPRVFRSQEQNQKRSIYRY